ncbi:MAG: hypothetical protein IKC34_02595 [Clostridia bacterium]|nr:hypothetical protein [Clostridia bacterium]
MKRYKQVQIHGGALTAPTGEVISLDGFFEALEYLSEREQTMLTEISEDMDKRGFLLLSFDMTARLFMQISSLIPSPVLKISLKGGELCILVCNRDGLSIPERAVLKLSKAAFLAGFGAVPSESGVSLTALVRVDRELAVYALSPARLVELFKKYFKE